ncbi:glycoside hydrolase family 16 protein [Collybiopsis luxurians FD-317 M1]|nr:glycoside hydrolase family 16 protein [Collybiopsis luxurians FD-317 M1]
MLLTTLIVFHWLFTFGRAYDLVREYSGITFFDDFDFYGYWDNLTLGDVNWLSESDAFSQGLAYVNSANNAIIKVDNMHSVIYPNKRNSVRITTKDSYSVGSLWIIDLVHIPYGCSVRPFWTMGPTWPNDGEIDIIEGINLMPSNQMALHTTPGCFHNYTPPNQLGETLMTDCSSPSGCTVGELQPNSFQSGFAEMGGGVFAAQFDVAGFVDIWFWSRPNVPSSITEATSTSSIDISQWGPPSANYIASDQCDITEFFTPQKLVLDITLCGNWAGLPEVYFPSCGNQGSTGLCYNDNVLGDGSNYNDAYFEIPYLRAYTTGGVAPTPTASAFEITSKVDLSAYPGYLSATVTGSAALATDTILHASPLFFPGNGAAPVSTRMGMGLGWDIGVWWAVSIGVVLVIRLV